MSNEEKKGFSGLSSLDSDIQPVVSVAKPEPEKKDEPKAEENHSKKNTSSPPSFSKVVPEIPDEPIVTFFKKYWLWIGIGLFFIWIWSSSNDKPSKPTPSYSYTPSPSYTPSIYEVKPSYGSGATLNTNEIYYCLAEGARIEANRSTTNTYDSFSIDRFNMTIDDYNNRCSSYRYQQSQFNAAQTEFDSNRYLIEAQGRARM